MSAAASTSKDATTSTKVTEQKKDANPALGVLEEDDEFEEFPVAGTNYRCNGLVTC
jgi:26 proteasome complex subunit DSS1